MSLKEQIPTDLSEVFFNSDAAEFAEVFVYRPGSGSGHYNVNVIFDASTQIAPTGGQSRVETKFIRIMAKEADIIGGVKPTDQLVGRGKLYRLAGPPESDGVGVVTLTLEEISDAPAT